MSTMSTTTRDWRIDWLRGLALVSIFINHMPGNRLENWTTRNFGFSDAAEVFVLLAGVAAAFAYFKRFEAGQQAETSRKALRRAVTRYGAHVASTLAAIVLFATVASFMENPGYLDLIGIAPLFMEPWPGLIGIMTGGYQLGYFNILPLYIVLLATLPVYMWLAKRDVRLMLGVSLALYVTAQVYRWELPNYPTGGGWYFNPFLWQLIFAIGLALGIMRLRGQWVAYHPAAYALALAYIVFSAVWMIWSLGGHVTHGLLPGWTDTLHKSFLPPPRLLHVLALGYLLVHTRAWQALSRLATADPVLTILGRNSLPVFVAGSLASMVGYIVLVETGTDIAVELALTVLGIGVMWLAAVFSEHGLNGALAHIKSTFTIGSRVPGVANIAGAEPTARTGRS
jgi:hypothetical protein